jgi:peptide/nickel transport system permease protein
MTNNFISILIKRIFTSLLLLFLMITFIFFLLRIAPGNPVQKYISPDLSPALIEKIKHEFELDKPVSEQYFSFIINVSKGELGISYNYRRPVIQVISEFLPFTLLFSAVSMFIQLTAGYFFALYFFRRPGFFKDRTASKVSIIIYSAPTFVTGVLLLFIFSELLNILPSSGIKSINHELLSIPEQVIDYAKHLILPVITLSAGGAALFYNYIKDNLVEVSTRPFVSSLKVFGLNNKEITKGHIIRNAMGPVVSAAGVEFGILLGGALITEVIFSLPGMGRLTVNAIFARDYPLIIGCTLSAGILVIFSNLTADLVRGKIDRRLFFKGILN